MAEDIISNRYWTGDWDPELPDYNTKTVDGVDVTALAMDDGNIFIGSKSRETGVYRNGYDEGSIYIDIIDYGSEIRAEVFPYGDETDSNRFSLYVFDGNGKYLETYESDTCGWEDGCEVYVGFNYDFSGSTKQISPSRYADSGGNATFETDRLLVACGTGYSAPDTWPEALESDDIVTNVNVGLQTEYCPSSTASVSLGVENQKFVGNLNDTIVVEELSTGSKEEIDVNLQPGEIQTVEADIQVSSSSGSDVEVVNVYLGGETIYTGTADIVDPSDGIGIDGVDIPEQVATGETVRGNAITIANTGACPTDIGVLFDGTEIGSSSIESGDSVLFEFDYTAADLTETQKIQHNISVQQSGDVIASSTSTVEVLGLTDVLNITDISIDGELVSERPVEATVSVENQSPDSYDVDLLIDGSSVSSGTVRSNDSSDISAEFNLPKVSGTEDVDFAFEIKADGTAVHNMTETLQVSQEHEFVELTDLRIPSKATSEETIGSREASAVVKTGIDDVYVEIKRDGSVIGSSTVRRSGTEEIDIEFTVPKVKERSTESIEVSAYVGDTTADTISQDIVVTGPASFISIDFLDAPSQMLSEDVSEVTADIVNEGEDEITVNLEYGGNVVSRNSIRGGSSDEFTFDFEAPSVDGSKSVSLKVTALVDGVVADESTTSIQVDNIASFIDIHQVNKPDSIYGGETVEIGVMVSNQYEETLDIDLEYDGSVVGSSSVRSENDSVITFEYIADDVSEVTDDEIELLAILDGDVVDGVVNTVTVNVATLDIDSTGFPESVCVGNDITVTATVSNPTNISRDALISVVSDEFGVFEKGVSDISAGRSKRGSISFTVPADASIESETISIVVERKADKYVEVDSTDFSVTINKPSASIQNIDVPREASPGNVSGSIEVANNSKCDIDAEVVVSGNTNSATIRSEGTEIVDVAFSLGTEDKTFDIKVINSVTGNTQDSSSLTITPVNYIEVDSKSNSVHTLITYSGMEIEGQVVGQNPDVTEDIRSEFDVLPNLAGASFSGELQASDSEARIINTDDLRFLNVGVGKDITWVVDGEVEGTSRSFRYSTSAIDGYIPDEELSPRRARTEVSGGLLSGIGIIRYRLGLK